MLRGLFLAVISVFALASGQEWEGTAANISENQIKVDGRLEEKCWKNAKRYVLDTSAARVGGRIDGNKDCWAEFSLLWDKKGLYLGVWFYDDVHSAPKSMLLDSAKEAYNDDAVEIFINPSYADASRDTATMPSFLGLENRGHQLIKGFGNLDAAKQFAAEWGNPQSYKGNPPWKGREQMFANYSVEDQQKLGWHNTFTTKDGKNYEYEALFLWSSPIMSGIDSIKTGAELGFNLYIDDNDGLMKVTSQYFLTPYTHTESAEHWGKLVVK